MMVWLRTRNNCRVSDYERFKLDSDERPVNDASLDMECLVTNCRMTLRDMLPSEACDAALPEIARMTIGQETPEWGLDPRPFFVKN